MILLFCAFIFLVLRLFYSGAEICFERDWPRRTWKGLLLSIVAFAICFSAFG